MKETKQKLEEQQKIQQQLDIDYTVYHCPYEDCRLMCELNCRIFRCGIHKTNNQQIPQHLPKLECDKLCNDPN